MDRIRAMAHRVAIATKTSALFHQCDARVPIRATRGRLSSEGFPRPGDPLKWRALELVLESEAA